MVAMVGSLALITVACGSDDSSSSTDTTAAAVETTAAARRDHRGGDADTTVPATDAAPSFEGDLVGTFAIDAGTCDGTAVSGSYFQMVQPGGTPEPGRSSPTPTRRAPTRTTRCWPPAPTAA